MYFKQVIYKIALHDAQTSFEGTFAHVEHTGEGRDFQTWEISKACNDHGAHGISTTACMFILEQDQQTVLKTRSTDQLIDFWNVMYEKTDIIAPGHAGEFLTNTFFTREF